MEEQTKTKRHMLRHTPGPWEPNGHEVRNCNGQGEHCVAVVSELTNAHLIAQAPTLLHYLKIAVEIIKNEYPEHQWVNYKVPEMEKAIAKAEGLQ